MSTEPAVADPNYVSVSQTSAQILTQKLQFVTDQQLQTPKSSTGVFTLPCGFIAPDGSLITDVVVREIKGKDEDLLASKKTLNSRKSTELLTRCIERLGPFTSRGEIAAAVPKLLSGDGVYLFIAIRRVTVGDSFAFKDQCPMDGCGYTYVVSTDLSTLETVSMPDPMKRSYSVTTPRGVEVEFHPQTIADENRIAEERTDESILSCVLKGRIDKMNGHPPTLEEIQELSAPERAFLRDAFESVEGGVETTLDMNCPKCGNDYEKELDISQGFFFRTETRKRSKKKFST